MEVNQGLGGTEGITDFWRASSITTLCEVRVCSISVGESCAGMGGRLSLLYPLYPQAGGLFGDTLAS